MADTILLLGHEKDTGMELVHILAGLGYQPEIANWEEFTPRAYRWKRPAALLVDVDQPHAKPMAELAQWVRKCWGKNYPVIAVAQSRKFRDTSELIDAGASDCLAKSAPPAMVERKLARALQGEKLFSSFGPSELAGEIPDSLMNLFAGGSGLTRLGDLADIHPGATPRRAWCRRLAPPDESWRGVITSAAMDRFYVGRPEEYLLWNRFHLFRVPAPEEYSVPEKVLLSRSGPPLAAAVDRSRLPAGNDVYSLVPKEGSSAGYIACLLNSRVLDFYFNRLAGAADGRLRIEAIRETPVPRPNDVALQETAKISTLLSHFGPSPRGWIDRQSKDELWDRMEETVFSLYGAGGKARNELAALHF